MTQKRPSVRTTFSRELLSELERQRIRYAVSPATVPVIPAVVVVGQAIRVGKIAKIVADLVPLIPDVPVRARVVKRTLDLRTDVENSSSLVTAVTHVAAVAVLVSKIVGRSDKPVSKLLKIVD